MTNQNPQKIKNSVNFFFAIIDRARLILRLMLDKRVNPFLKLIPIFGIIYVISPFDFPGPLDDIAVFTLALVIFVEACPKSVVKEHLAQIHPQGMEDNSTNEDVIDVEFKNVDDPNSKE